MSLAEKARPDGVLRSKPGPAGQYVDLPRQGVTPRARYSLISHRISYDAAVCP